MREISDKCYYVSLICYALFLLILERISEKMEEGQSEGDESEEVWPEAEEVGSVREENAGDGPPGRTRR